MLPETSWEREKKKRWFEKKTSCEVCRNPHSYPEKYERRKKLQKSWKIMEDNKTVIDKRQETFKL